MQMVGFYSPVSVKLLKPPKEFYEAAEKDNVKVLKKYLKGQHDVDVPQGFGNNSVTGLVLAIQHGSKNAVEKLVKKGCKVNYSCGPLGWSPLHYAVNSNKVGYVKFLLHYKAEVDRPDHFKKTPLMLASEIGNWSICELLLKAGASLNPKTPLEPLYPLPLNLQKLINQPRMSQEHLEDIKAPYSGCSAVLKASWNGHLDIVKKFIERGADVQQVTSSGYNGLHIAASQGSAELLHLMLANKCDVNQKTLNGETPLHIATRNMFSSVHHLNASSEEILKLIESHATIVKHLIQHGADQSIQNKNGHTVLFQMLSLSFPRIQHQKTLEGIREEMLSLLNEYTDRLSPRNIPPTDAVSPDLKSKQVLAMIVQNANSPRKLQNLARSVIRKTLGPSRLKMINRTNLAPALQRFVAYDMC